MSYDEVVSRDPLWDQASTSGTVQGLTIRIREGGETQLKTQS